MNRIVSWIYFGDLHISEWEDQNHRDFLILIDEANRCMRSGIAFALLPGDNADDGQEDQYKLVQAGVSLCRFPVHAITGDHDVAGGSLDLFRRYLSRDLFKSFTIESNHFVFLNSVANWHPPVFGLGVEQMAWLRDDLRAASNRQEPIIVFLHAYPSEHGADLDELGDLIHHSGVKLVEMGHTHYNELANDGRTIYATTRSTGQIEEGPAGFSVTTLDGGVVSWKFKPVGEWPLVMITSPADERLIVDASSPAQVVRGNMPVRARVWGRNIDHVTMSIDGAEAEALETVDECTWEGFWDFSKVAEGAADGPHAITVSAYEEGRVALDRIQVYVNRLGHYTASRRHALDYENTLPAWLDTHILGTQLGPNENGRHWPSRHEQERAAQ